MEITYGHFVVAIAWAALWVHIAVVPFLRDSLHKDHSANRDLALSNIEAKKMEALAELIEAANQAKESNAAQGRTVEYTALLLEAKFQPIWKRAQDADEESRNIRRSWEVLTHIASRLWQSCLVHGVSIVAILGVAAAISDEKTRDVLIAGLVVIAVGSFVFMIWKLVSHDLNRKRLLKILDNHGGKANAEK